MGIFSKTPEAPAPASLPADTDLIPDHLRLDYDTVSAPDRGDIEAWIRKKVYQEALDATRDPAVDARLAAQDRAREAAAVEFDELQQRVPADRHEAANLASASRSAWSRLIEPPRDQYLANQIDLWRSHARLYAEPLLDDAYRTRHDEAVHAIRLARAEAAHAERVAVQSRLSLEHCVVCGPSPLPARLRSLGGEGGPQRNLCDQHAALATAIVTERARARAEAADVLAVTRLVETAGL